MELDEAKSILISYASDSNENLDGFASYGYEIYLPSLVSHYIRHQTEIPEHDQAEFNSKIMEIGPIFMDAAWDLSKKGILRPGIKRFGAQTTGDGASGNGFSITSYGREWLSAEGDNSILPSPNRFSKLIEPFIDLLGVGFQQRAIEASQTYETGSYLACTTMCGAASESILLAIAISKDGNEEEVLKKYRSANGRKKIENLILGQATDRLKRLVTGHTDLLNYWRDEAAHGSASEISEFEANEAMARLLRFSQLAADNWAELTE